MSRYRRLLTDALTFHTINKSIITMTESLTLRDDGFHERLLFLDPNGFDRTVVPLGTFTVGYTIVIFNTASVGDIVFDPNVLAYTVHDSDTYGPGVFTYTTDGWECRSPKTVYLETSGITLGSLEGTLDDIADGTIYGRVNLSSISAGAVLLSAALGSLDDISDGTTYARVASTSISAGKILLSEAEGNLDDVEDGTNYAKVAVTSISAGKILLSQAEGTVDDLTDGTTYSRVLTADLSAGHIALSSCSGSLDDIADGTYGKILSTYITAGMISITGVDGVGDLATADSVDWQTQVEGWGKPADNATVGATWGSNLYSIPTRFGNSASSAGLYATSTYFGYWNGSSWNAYIRSNGYFYFGDGSTRYIYWNGSTLTISTPDDVTIQQGGDLVLINDVSNYARIVFDGTSYNIYQYSYGGGLYWGLVPSSDGSQYMSIGGAGNHWKEIVLYGEDNIRLYADQVTVYSGTKFLMTGSYITMTASSPPTPAATECIIFAKSDGSFVRPYYKLSNGTEYVIDHT